MDGLGTKISAKIRLAIKTKLIKLKAYVDDELPDYIMVMLTNHRTKTQIEKGLSLFLKNKTTAFTNWLFAVIERLKKVTFEEVAKKEVKKMKVSEKPVKKGKEAKEKSGKYSGRLERSSATSGASPKERKSSSFRPSKPKTPKSVPVSKDIANMAELGLTKRTEKRSSGGLDGRRGAEGYNPTSMLKSAFGKTNENKTSSRMSSKKERSSSSGREPSKMAKEDREVEREEKEESEDKRNRSRVKDDKGKNSGKERPQAIMKGEVKFYAGDSRTRNRSGGGSPRQSEVPTAPGAESKSGDVEVGWGGRFQSGKAFRQPSLATLRTFLNFQIQNEDNAKKEKEGDDQCTVIYERDQGAAEKRKMDGKWSGQGFPVSKTPTISEVKEAEPSTGLRPIIIDGSNVAMAHGKNKVFSAKGIKLVADYFKNNGHCNIVAFVPQFRKKSGKVVDRAMLQELEEEGVVVFTPSREVDGERITSYDDPFILDFAAKYGGVVVSKDNYRDLAHSKPEWMEVVKKRILMPTFVGEDVLMWPHDPLGRGGLTLDQFLSF